MVAAVDASWTEADRAWLAAFLDGEAWIGVAKTKQATSRGGYWYRAGIVVKQVQPDPIDHVHDLLGGRGTRFFQKARGRDRAQHGLNILNQGLVKEILLAILPQLVTKRTQAETVLALREVVDTVGYTDEGRAEIERLYRRVRHLNQAPPHGSTDYHTDGGVVDAAWLAAAIEGEGSIGIYRRKATGRMKNDIYILRVAVGTTDRVFVERCRDIAGCGNVAVERRGPKRRAIHRWTVTTRQALSVLNRVEPYLQYKRQHPTIARQLYAEGRVFNLKAGATAEQQAVQVQCYEAMARLNRKGVAT